MNVIKQKTKNSIDKSISTVDSDKSDCLKPDAGTKQQSIDGYLFEMTFSFEAIEAEHVRAFEIRI